MFFVIGLGNPEKRYAGTRHNIGFEVVDRLAQELRLQFKPGRGEFLIAQGSFREHPLVLIKPVTFMNESGVAVTEVREQFDARNEDLFVVCDDFQLPLGQLRLRLRGSDGGHNGLYSIIYHLQSEEFPRLRCGIASSSMPADKNQMADFVLSRFTAEELPLVNEMIPQAKDACLRALTDGITKTMNVFNKKTTLENDTPNN
ncbi:MAG: aminoacyl-tRNA hydrolase [Ignavibacteriales bacterium]|nr:aminoacyl-tRNA hydrolase [Ignavibacteriales bacterium]